MIFFGNTSDLKMYLKMYSTIQDLARGRQENKYYYFRNGSNMTYLYVYKCTSHS